MKLQLYRCYKSDKRMSMDFYADSLEAAATSLGYSVSAYRPESRLERFHKNLLVMRYLRYRQYPKKVASFDAGDDIDIHHVVDHGYAHLYPGFGEGKKVVTVHDLIPFLNWRGLIDSGSQAQSSRAQRKPSLNIYSLSFLKRYDKIIAVSHNTAMDIHRHFDIPLESIAVIPSVLNQYFRPIPEEALSEFRQKYSLDRQSKYILISGREFYKNHQRCLQAYSNLLKNTEQSIKLVRMGLPSTEFDDSVDEMGLDGAVLNLFLADSEELPLLYNIADCLLFPSLYEGFGMPVAEALACGTPVVISDRGSLPEVVGDLATPVDALDVDGIAAAVLQAITEQSFIDSIGQRGPSAMNRYKSENITKRISSVYQALAIN